MVINHYSWYSSPGGGVTTLAFFLLGFWALSCASMMLAASTPLPLLVDNFAWNNVITNNISSLYDNYHSHGILPLVLHILLHCYKSSWDLAGSDCCVRYSSSRLEETRFVMLWLWVVCVVCVGWQTLLMLAPTLIIIKQLYKGKWSPPAIISTTVYSSTYIDLSLIWSPCSAEAYLYLDIYIPFFWISFNENISIILMIFLNAWRSQI